jgi:hypothetical protein
MDQTAFTDPPQTERQRYLRDWYSLDQEYSTWKPVHEDIVDFFQPGRGRFELAQQNRGQRKDQNLVNDTGVDASNKLASAMDTGITSPAREWFRLTTSAPEVNEQDEIRQNLSDWQQILFQVLGKSNFYQTNRALYLDVIGPGVGVMFMDEDEDEYVRFVHCPIGQFRLATDARGRVSRIFRRFSMTVRQIVEEFCTNPDGSVDLSKVSQRVKDAYGRMELDSVWVDIIHVVEKREKRERGQIGSKSKPWASCWLEWNGPGEQRADDYQGLLKESGYDEQPFVAPRWSVVGEDAYGRASPGWQCLGDARALQAMERGSAKIVAKLGDPALNVPDALRNASTLPGAKNHVPNGAAFKIEPTYAIPPEAVTVTAQEKRVFEGRINRGHFADLLLMISNDERGQPATAEEVRAKKEERLLQLGGVFARYAEEALRIVIDRVFRILQRRGLIKRPQGDVGAALDLRIEFENPLVTAQRTIQLASIERLVATAANISTAGRQDVLELLDVDEIMRTTAGMLGVTPKLLRNQKEVDKVRAARQQQQQAQQQGEAMTKAAPALKQLSETDPEKMRQLVQQFGPNAAAQATGSGA